MFCTKSAAEIPGEGEAIPLAGRSVLDWGSSHRKEAKGKEGSEC